MPEANVDVLRRAGRVRAAARRKGMRAERALPRRRLPRRRDPGRDRSLRPRLPAAALGIQQVQLETGVPCAFGVLTVDNMDQALARSGGGKRDQGHDAARTAVRMARLVGTLRSD